ncbi:MAG: class II aldolase/adducin family protein [Verrucomicrobiota bacterium]|nr:class II aldolase/adducin family protein [Verrucomicrobiota bacterium]
MKLFSQKDAEVLVKTGAMEFRVPAGVIVTPGAKDILIAARVKMITGGTGTTIDTKSVDSASPESVFNSDEARKIKDEICEIGKRLWAREMVDGNGGNISYRIRENMVICTPTLVSKGFMTPDMICMVDLEGKQIAGSAKRTSEITTHLAIYKGAPAAKAVVHAHPVYGTAFAIAGVEPPQCLIPELEVFAGKVILAPYQTPGSKAMAETIQPLSEKHQAILMGSHGVICWGFTVEDAYWKMENTDSFCRTVLAAAPLKGNAMIPGEKVRELLDIRKSLGMPDPRYDLKPVELCELDPWEVVRGNACSCKITPETKTATGATGDVEMERVVQQITDQILKQMGGS